MLAIGLMVCAVILVYWSPRRVGMVQPAGDYHQLHKLRMEFARDALFGAGHALPAWYPRELMGSPFWSNVQSFPFIPNRLLLLVLFDPQGPYAFTFGVTLAAVLASLFTYLYCRKIGLGLVASAAAGWSFACSGYFASRIVPGHLPLLEVYCALPLMLWAVEGMTQAMQHDRPTMRWIIALGLGSLCLSLAGHPQLSIYALVAAAIYARWRGSIMQAFRTVLAMGLGVGCAAFVMLPMSMLIGRSTRILALARADNDLAMPYRRLIGFFLPWFDGAALPLVRGRTRPFDGYPNGAYYWDTVCFMGWMPWVALALLAVWWLKTRKTRTERLFSAPWVFILGMGIAGVVLALPVVQTMLTSIPGTLLRSPARLVYLTEFALAMALGAAVHLALTISPARWVRGVAAAVLGVHAIQMASFDHEFMVQVPLRREIDPQVMNSLILAIGDARIGIDATIHVAANRKVDDIGFFDSIMLAKPYRFIMDLSRAPVDTNMQYLMAGMLYERPLSCAGVRLVLTRADCPDLKLEDELGGIRLYSVPKPAARATFYHMDHVRFFTTERIHDYLRDPAVDVNKVLALPIEARPADINSTDDSAAFITSGSVVYHRPDSDVIVCKVTTPGRGYLRVIESWDPGWSATVDGVPAPILPGWDALLSVPVPQGVHEVRFEYRTPGAVAGQGISLISLLALTGYALWPWRKKAVPPESTPDPGVAAAMTTT